MERDGDRQMTRGDANDALVAGQESTGSGALEAEDAEEAVVSHQRHDQLALELGQAGQSDFAFEQAFIAETLDDE